MDTHEQFPNAPTLAWGSPVLKRPNTNMSTITSDEEIEQNATVTETSTSDVKFALPSPDIAVTESRPTTAITPASPVSETTTPSIAPEATPVTASSESGEVPTTSDTNPVATTDSRYPKVVLMKNWVEWKPEYVESHTIFFSDQFIGRKITRANSVEPR